MLTCKQMKILNIVLSVGAIAYTGYVHYRTHQTNEVLGNSITNISENIDVEVSEAIVQEAVKIAVDRETAKAVKTITNNINDILRRDVKHNVKLAVHDSYAEIRESVSKELGKNVANLDMNALRADVKEEAKTIVLGKFNENLDSLLNDFNQNLTNVSKIYGSIADSMVRKPQETVFKIGN